MYVVVPDVLVATRLVVLTGGDTVAAVLVTHRDGDLTNEIVDRMPIFAWQVVQILMVLVRDDKHVPAVVRPPPRRYQGRCERTLANNVSQRVGHRLGPSKNVAERTLVARGLVVEHLATLTPQEGCQVRPSASAVNHLR
jgi:hypothetical protein